MAGFDVLPGRQTTYVQIGNIYVAGEQVTAGDSHWQTTRLSTLLGNVDVPVTLARGPSEEEFDGDVLTHENVSVETLPDGGHLVSLKCPAEFAAIIESHI